MKKWQRNINNIVTWRAAGSGCKKRLVSRRFKDFIFRRAAGIKPQIKKDMPGHVFLAALISFDQYGV
ncbi:MAG: hypothetical protein ABI171_17725 [Collimonas sp.]|uniref:hypothetical protein n=1 Tax=Collimonas sp. TaxID=1963772 RepID=UPI003263E5DD